MGEIEKKKKEKEKIVSWGGVLGERGYV